MPYTISYFGLTTADLNRLRQASARFILKRHWLEAEILPHVLRYFGIATLLDPAVSATIAATGLYLREGNPVQDLGHQNGREECGNPRQKSVVLALMDLWSPYVGLEELVGAVAATHGPIPKKLSALKKVILNRMEQEAKSRIIKKIHKEGWSGGISPEWVVLLAGAPKKLCNGTGRYTLLRWAVNQDDDVWLSMRGTRHQQKCGTCGLPGESFPHGYYQPPLCESCIRAVKLNAWALAPWSQSLCDAYTAEDCQNQLTNWTQEWNVQPAHVVVCRACGCGDNTIGHWTRCTGDVFANATTYMSNGYELLRQLTREFSLRSRTEALSLRVQLMSRTFQVSGSEAEISDLIRQIDFSVARFMKLASTLGGDVTGLKIDDSDMLSMLVRSLPTHVKDYVLLHATGDTYASYREAARRFEYQHRLFRDLQTKKPTFAVRDEEENGTVLSEGGAEQAMSTVDGYFCLQTLLSL